MARYIVVDAELFRAAIITEVVGDDERVAADAIPTALMRAGGAYVMRRNATGPRYLAAPPGAAAEKVIFLETSVEPEPEPPVEG